MNKYLKSPDWLRALLLTLLHGIYMCGGLPLLIVAIFWGNSYYSIEEIFIYAALLTPPMLFGLFLVNRPKWWMISLPVQLLVNAGMLVTANYFEVPVLITALFFLTLQSVGVGIGMVVRRFSRKCKKQPQSICF